MRLSRVLQSGARYFSPFVRFVLATPFHRIMSTRLMLLRFTWGLKGQRAPHWNQRIPITANTTV
jgi:hypothetical protein